MSGKQSEAMLDKMVDSLTSFPKIGLAPAAQIMGHLVGADV